MQQIRSNCSTIISGSTVIGSSDRQITASVSLSTAEVASSKTKTGGFFKTAIARYKLITI
ncbi:hypothetical protein [Nostoc sp.]|uniref:hypothetical protein n=1 Tax=Nostoc sp. TaxID=1180 RepID=UPI002FF51A08